MCALEENRRDRAYSYTLGIDSTGRRDLAQGTEELVSRLLQSESLIGGNSYRGKDS